MSLAKVSRIGPIGETYVDVLSKVYDLLEFFCRIQTPFGRVRAGATRLYHSPAPEIVMFCPETVQVPAETKLRFKLDQSLRLESAY